MLKALHVLKGFKRPCHFVSRLFSSKRLLYKNLYLIRSFITFVTTPEKWDELIPSQLLFYKCKINAWNLQTFIKPGLFWLWQTSLEAMWGHGNYLIFLQLKLFKYRKDRLLRRTSSAKDSMSEIMTCTANPCASHCIFTPQYNKICVSLSKNSSTLVLLAERGQGM